MSKKILIAMVFILVCFFFSLLNSQAGTRKNANGGVIPDDGECVSNYCVLYEGENSAMLFQYVDTDFDKRCNFTVKYKKLIDPTFGTYYLIVDVVDCSAALVDERKKTKMGYES